MNIFYLEGYRRLDCFDSYEATDNCNIFQTNHRRERGRNEGSRYGEVSANVDGLV